MNVSVCRGLINHWRDDKPVAPLLLLMAQSFKLLWVSQVIGFVEFPRTAEKARLPAQGEYDQCLRVSKQFKAYWLVGIRSGGGTPHDGCLVCRAERVSFIVGIAPERLPASY